MFCGSGGPKKYEKVGSLKQRSGRMRDQKLHAPVARSKSGSQNGKTSSASEHFWSCSKSARGCCAKRSSTKRDIKSMFCSRGIHWSKKCTVDHTVWCKARFEVKKWWKHHMFAPFLEVAWLKKCTQLWRKTHFEVKNVKADSLGPFFKHFWTLDAVMCGMGNRFRTFPKVSENKNDGRRGPLTRICKDAFHVAGVAQQTCPTGRGFPERGCILKHGIFRFATLILSADSCSTSYDLASLFRDRCNTLDRSGGKIAKCIDWCQAVSFAHNSLFLKEISRNGFVFESLLRETNYFRVGVTHQNKKS